MLQWLVRAERSVLVACGLGAAALIGWSAFAYSAWSSRGFAHQVGALTAERDEARARYARLAQSGGDLAEVEAKLGAARMEYSRTVEAWAKARAGLGAAQQELAAQTKRLELSKDRVSQTGSIRPPEASKGPARKP
jgi:hypothetical protein